MGDMLSLTQAATGLGVNPQTLRRWHKAGKLRPSFISPGGHRYYLASDIKQFMDPLFQEASLWAKAPKDTAPPLSDDVYCQNQAVFQYRLGRFSSDLEAKVLPDMAAILVAITGEIGNNSFDHNLGNWLDVPGVYFGYDVGKGKIVLADRGQGILKTLCRVRPTLTDDQEALRVAFSEVISGRAPESRGNGLKFVREQLRERHLLLSLQSGTARWSFIDDEEQIVAVPEKVFGTLTRIDFSL